MTVKLLTEHHLEFLSLKGGCRSSSESTHVKMSLVGNLMHWLIYFPHRYEFLYRLGLDGILVCFCCSSLN